MRSGHLSYPVNGWSRASRGWLRQKVLPRAEPGRMIPGVGQRDMGDWNSLLTDASKARLNRCMFRDSRFAGSDINKSAMARFENCTFEKGDGFGLFATGQANIKLNKTRVRGYGGRGIELQDRTSITVTDSRVENNSDYAI